MIKQLFRYGLVAALSYGILIFGTFLLVEEAGLSPSVAYFLVISICYIFNYFACSGFVFSSKMDKQTVRRYVIYLVIFWAINNLIFNYLVVFFGIPYLAAIILNIAVLGLIRFFIQKKYVFV